MQLWSRGSGGAPLRKGQNFSYGDGEFLRDKPGRDRRCITVSSCNSIVTKLLTLYFNSLFPCLLSCTRLSASLGHGPYFFVHCYFLSAWPKVRYSITVCLG